MRPAIKQGWRVRGQQSHFLNVKRFQQNRLVPCKMHVFSAERTRVFILRPSDRCRCTIVRSLMAAICFVARTTDRVIIDFLTRLIQWGSFLLFKASSLYVCVTQALVKRLRMQVLAAAPLACASMMRRSNDVLLFVAHLQLVPCRPLGCSLLVQI